MLNQLFNRGLLGANKTCLTLGIARIKLLQNRRDVQLKQMRKEIAQFLQTGQEAIARIRVEHVIREQNIWAAYGIIEMFCEFILARVPILESQRECPPELQEAIASIMFAAPRCSDLPDLLQVKNLFAAKYGKEFASSVSELRPDSGVNRTIIEKLSVSAPPPELRLKVLKDIAREYGVAWDPSRTEAELNKKHEDLLGLALRCVSPKSILCCCCGEVGDGSKRGNEDVILKAPIVQQPLNSQILAEPHFDPTLLSTKQSIYHVNNSLLSPKVIESPKGNNNKMPAAENQRETKPDSSEALERARAAIASAERASAAARAAAQLVNAEFGLWKLEGKY
ncbi:IST1-like protein [Drosera capensis]